jgi:hypothetical protein
VAAARATTFVFAARATSRRISPERQLRNPKRSMWAVHAATIPPSITWNCAGRQRSPRCLRHGIGAVGATPSSMPGQASYRHTFLSTP